MNKRKGITLLALVITIVIMLLLAGVAIQMTMGENWLIAKSNQAKKEQAKAELLENAKLGYLNLKTKAIEKGEHNPEVELVLVTKEFTNNYNIVDDNITDKSGNIIETKQEILNTLKILYPKTDGKETSGGVEIPEEDKDKMILKLKVLDETKEIYFGAFGISESLTPIKIDYGNGTKGEIVDLYDGESITYNRGEYIIKVEETGYFAMGGQLHSFLGEGIEVEIIHWGKVKRDKEYYFERRWNIRIPNVSKIYEPEPEEIEVFYENAKMSEIPKDLFKNKKGIKYISRFVGSKTIKSIPEDLFKECTDIERFSETFSDCENLENIPENLFKYNTKVKEFYGTFSRM